MRILTKQSAIMPSKPLILAFSMLNFSNICFFSDISIELFVYISEQLNKKGGFANV